MMIQDNKLQNTKKYSILASDLDGTLLDDNSQISKENMDAISKLSDIGAYFVPASGRTLCEIPLELKDNPKISYIIYSNGAVIENRKDNTKILNCISNATSQKILDIITSFETHILFRQNGQSFVDSKIQNEKSFEYFNLVDAHIDCVLKYANYIDDFIKFAYSADNVEVFSVFFHTVSDKEKAKEKLKNISDIHIVEPSEYNLEIFNINAGKGKALLNLADMLGVDYSETISVGDSDNDFSITKASGLGLAVSNACDALKKVADKVICSNNEHVVEYILLNYFDN